MWLIGFQSGIISLLAMIAYALFLHVTQLSHSVLGYLEYLVFGMGIYSSYYYYAQATQGRISFYKGLQIGMVAVFFVGITIGMLTAFILYSAPDDFMGMIFAAMESASSTLPEKENIDMKHFKTLLTPNFLVISVFSSLTLVGFVFTLLFSWLASRPGRAIK